MIDYNKVEEFENNCLDPSDHRLTEKRRINFLNKVLSEGAQCGWQQVKKKNPYSIEDDKTAHKTWEYGYDNAKKRKMIKTGMKAKLSKSYHKEENMKKRLAGSGSIQHDC